MKFLVDECLSPELTKRAHARGYGEILPCRLAGAQWPEGLGARLNQSHISTSHMKRSIARFRGFMPGG